MSTEVWRSRGFQEDGGQVSGEAQDACTHCPLLLRWPERKRQLPAQTTPPQAPGPGKEGLVKGPGIQLLCPSACPWEPSDASMYITARLTEAKNLKCPARKLLGYVLTMKMPLLKHTLSKDF